MKADAESMIFLRFFPQRTIYEWQALIYEKTIAVMDHERED